MDDQKQDTSEFLERRRQLLKLGAAGMPMILTLKASANQTVHSALDCVFKLTSAVNILVDHEGKVWVGSSTIDQGSGGTLKTSDITAFKSNADFAFPAGTAPEDYVPDECPDDPCDGDSSGDWDDDDWYFGGTGRDLLQELMDSGSISSFKKDKDKDKDKGGDDDDCGNSDDDDDDDDDWDDDDGGSGGSGGTWTDCGYNYYEISANTTITPLDYLNGNGDWQISGTNGLYIVLGAKYLDYYGNDGGFPGISCLHSILTYLETA